MAGQRISLKLTDEQKAQVKKVTGKEAEVLEFDLEELEDRIAPARVVRVKKF